MIEQSKIERVRLWTPRDLDAAILDTQDCMYTTDYMHCICTSHVNMV